ncbi:MAG TPA: TraR/DksA C4-type zinc finger protein [Acidimicrobiia bacterium]|nr:TraR/DksA C4-type zinc finger protein [Acidimicrobiia bacterium]
MAKAEPKTKPAPRRPDAGSAKREATRTAPAKKAAAQAIGKVSKGAASKASPSRKAAPDARKAAPAPKKALPARAVAKRAAPAKRAEPVKAAAGRSGTAKKEPARREPAKKVPAKKEAAKKEAAKKEPAAKPVAAKPEPVKKPPRKTTVICPLSGFEVKPDKPNLSPRTIERLRARLLEERARHLSQADQLLAEAAQLALDREEGDTQFDEEGGEGDTISVERERDLMLSASARQIVEEIDRALERMRNKTYGLCTPAGRRISVERLEALPYAETCVDCKARAERRR